MKKILLALTFLLLFEGCQKTEVTQVKLSAIGDVMMHASVQAFANAHPNGYDELFARVKDDLIKADITFANLETQTDDTSHYSGYPQFNAPSKLLAALKNIGIDIVSSANNHSLDRFGSGHVQTLQNLQKHKIEYVGSGKNLAEAQSAKILTVKDIRLGFLGYSYSTNGIAQPAGDDTAKVNIIDIYNEKNVNAVLTDVRKLRPMADFVIVSLHWGNEYVITPENRQVEVARQIFEAGADIILGHHPHMLQPLEKYTTRDGRQGLVIYSLGNFVSSMNSNYNWHNRDGHYARTGDSIVLNIVLQKTVIKKIFSEEQISFAIAAVDFLPLYNLVRREGPYLAIRMVNIDREVARMGKEEPHSELWQNFLLHRKKIIESQIKAPRFETATPSTQGGR